VAALNYSIAAWGVVSQSEPLLASLGAFTEQGCYGWRMVLAFCPNPPRIEDWQMPRIIGQALRQCDPLAGVCTLAVVTKREDDFNSTNLALSLYRDYPSRCMAVVNIMEFGGPYRLSWLTGDFVVYIPGARHHERYRDAVTRFLDDSASSSVPGVYSLVGEYPLPRQMTAKLLKRTRRLTRGEVTRCVRALEVEPALTLRLIRAAEALSVPP
jgi:hypothetical protein